MSSGNDVAIIAVPETTFNTTPVDSDDWFVVPWSDADSLTGQVETDASTEVQPHNQLSDQFVTRLTVGGDVPQEWSIGRYNPFLEAAFRSDFSGGVLEIGQDQKSFSIQKNFGVPVGAVEYMLMTGMRIGTFALTTEFGGKSTVTWSFAGSGITPKTTTDAVGLGAAPADPAPLRVLNGSSDIINIQVGGASYCVQSLSLNIEHSLRPRECMGNIAPDGQLYGSTVVSGSGTLYLENLTLFEDMINNTDNVLTFQFNDGTNTETWLAPKVKLSGSPDSGGRDGDNFYNFDFQCIYDSVTGTSLRVTQA